ncbi:bublin coiled-coil protein [Neosynchiropus ocellatus]
MSGPNSDPDMSVDDVNIDEEEEFGDEEYAAINSMLDQINSYLDGIEERNDALNGKLHDLMESNRQARQEFQAQLLNSSVQEDDKPDTTDNPDKDQDSCGSQTPEKSS